MLSIVLLMESGHGKESVMDNLSVTLAAIAVVLSGLSLCILFYASTTIVQVKVDAVERGYALYCPLDGEWAWKGECDG